MFALVVLILGFFAITAIFAYYLMVAMLIAIGVAFMTVVSISLFVGSEVQPSAGLATFPVLGAMSNMLLVAILYTRSQYPQSLQTTTFFCFFLILSATQILP